MNFLFIRHKISKRKYSNAAFGDITIIRTDDSVEIIEVKSSNTKSGRRVRQKQAMNEVVTLLASGGGQLEDRDVRIEIMPITPESGLDQVERLLTKADVAGWAAQKISNCLYVEAVDFRKMETIDDVKSWLGAEREKVLGAWDSKGDFVVEARSIDGLAFSPNCAPFAVFPFSSKLCVELAIGAKVYSTFLNLTAVAREFEIRGWTIRKTIEQLLSEGSKTAMMTVSKDNFYADIPPAECMRMQMETLRPKTLIQIYERKYKEGPKGSHGHTLAIFKGESEMWR